MYFFLLVIEGDEVILILFDDIKVGNGKFNF